MDSYRELKVWQNGMRICSQVYEVTKEFPKAEQFGITSQMQRAAVSIPANIAEGHGRGSTKDYLRYLSIARGSLAELETLLTLAYQFRYLDSPRNQLLMSACDEQSRMLRGLQRSLRTKLAPIMKAQKLQ
jgi:four helix bundle protein